MISTPAPPLDPASPADLAQLRGELAALLPPPTSSAVIATADHSERLFADERPLIAQAAQARIDSFSSGRLAARMALGRAMGAGADVAIPSDRGAPVPPPGWRLSITHGDRFAAAAACRAQDARGLGIDLERIARMDPAWRRHVVGPRDRLWETAGAYELTVVFSLKESLFKALSGERDLAGAAGVHWDRPDDTPRIVWNSAPGQPRLQWGARRAGDHVLTCCLAL